MKHRVLIAGSGNITGLNVVRALTHRMHLMNLVVQGYDYVEPKQNPSTQTIRNHIVPRCSDPNYKSSVLDLVERFQPTTIIASNDHDVRALSEMSQSLTGIAINGLNDTTHTWLDKSATSTFFKNNDVVTPQQNPAERPFVIRKNHVGDGQKFTRIIKAGDGHVYIGDRSEVIVTQFIEGPEYTVDVFCDLNCEPLAVVPRRRHEVRAGIVHFGEVENNELVISESRRVAKLARLVGINCMQCIVNGGKCYFFEINPRPGSGLDLTTASGVNMPLLWLSALAGEKIKVSTPDWGLKMVRFHDGYFFK